MVEGGSYTVFGKREELNSSRSDAVGAGGGGGSSGAGAGGAITGSQTQSGPSTLID